MRFDDRLATLLAQRQDSEDARVALWRQLVDLLAQGRIAESDRLEDEAIETIAELRAAIPAQIKADTARTFAGRPISAAVIALYAEEPATVVGPLISAARLDADQWLSLLPTLTPTARALLRHRRDLPSKVARALDSFGPADFVIPLGPHRIAMEEMSESGPWVEPEPAPTHSGETTEIFEPEPEQPDWPAFAKVGAEENAGGELPLRRSRFAAFVPDAGVEASSEEPMPLADLIDSVVGADEEPLPPPPDIDAETQIRDLMARIEAYRAHDFVRPAEAPLAGEVRPLESEENAGRFRFETAADGSINWVGGAPGGVLIGTSIARTTIGADSGVDAHASGAFRQRAPFRDARLLVPGSGSHADEWRISAVPMFDPANGRFCGYRGSARRPRVDEIASPTKVPGLFGAAETTDSLRQLVHELRTPLNAIIGFSEMIEGQYLGPASARYREKATDISVQGRRLLKALEDLDVTTRAEGGGEAGPVDPVALIGRLHDEYQALADDRGFALEFKVVTTLGPVSADPVAVERVISRLLSATLAVAQPGETIRVTLDHDPEHRNRMMLTIVRPALLAGRDERTLLDPGYNPDGDMPEAPILGLGFALRLVRNIATANGGTLDIQPDSLILRLPLRRISARRGKG